MIFCQPYDLFKKASDFFTKHWKTELIILNISRRNQYYECAIKVMEHLYSHYVKKRKDELEFILSNKKRNKIMIKDFVEFLHGTMIQLI